MPPSAPRTLFNQVVARKSGGTPYSIARLSDGERNALLVAADVLTVRPGTLVVIDDPEMLKVVRSFFDPLPNDISAP
jgi:hypothetical protein